MIQQRDDEESGMGQYLYHIKIFKTRRIKTSEVIVDADTITL